MSQFVTYRDSNGVVRQIEVYSLSDYTSQPAVNKPIKTNSSGYVDPSLIDPSGDVKAHTQTFTLTSQDIINKKVILEHPLIYDFITLLPEGGIPQRNGIDFEYLSTDNSVSWNNMGLDGFLEENETLEVSYFYR